MADTSAQYCGCDAGANWICEQHRREVIHQTLYGVESWEPGMLVEIDSQILRVESRDGPHFTFTRAIPEPGEVPIRLQRPIELEP